MKFNLKSFTTALMLLLLSNISPAQDLQFSNFSWSEKPALHKLTASEQKESVVMLEEFSAVEYIYNEKQELEQYSFRHKIMALNDDKAVESANRIYLPARKPENLTTMKARVINSKGVVKELGRDDMKQINEDGVEYLILALEGLEKGCEVEYYYFLKRPLNYWGTESLQGSYFVRHSELQIISPANLKMEAKVYNGKSTFDQNLSDDKRTLKCITDSIVPRYNENYSANDANTMRVEYKMASNSARGDKRFFTFEDAGERYYSMLTSADKDELKEVKNVMKKLDLNNKTEAEKIFTIENYIKTNIQLLEESDDDNLKTILKNKYGSEVGIMKLYVAMFEETAVRYQTVITCSRYERTFDKDFDSWVFLQNYLFYFPDIKMYLDPVAVVYRLGLIPYIYENNYGLFIAGVKLGDATVPFSEVKKVEAANVKLSHDDMECMVTFPADFNKANVHQVRKMSGHSAVGVQPYYELGKEDDKKEIVKALVQLKGEETNVSNEKVSNAAFAVADEKKPFTIECDYSSAYLLEAAGDNYILKIGEIIGPQVEMYSDKPRVNPVMMEFTHSYLRIIKVMIPDGYEVKGADKLNIDISLTEADGTKPIGFISNYKIENKMLTVTVNEFYNITELPVAKFEEFRKVINASADFNKIAVVLSKK